jgi:hypothetical protein
MLFQCLLVLIRTARDEPVGFEVEVIELDSADDVSGYMLALAEALVAEARGDVRAATRHYASSVDSAYRVMGTEDDFAIVWPLGVEALLAAGEVGEAERLVRHVADVAPGLVSPLARVHLLRLRALVASARGDDAERVEADLDRATDAFREFGVPFYLARTLLERGHLLAGRGDDAAAAPLLAEAEELFTGLRANRWLAQLRGVSSVR